MHQTRHGGWVGYNTFVSTSDNLLFASSLPTSGALVSPTSQGNGISCRSVGSFFTWGAMVSAALARARSQLSFCNSVSLSFHAAIIAFISSTYRSKKSLRLSPITPTAKPNNCVTSVIFFCHYCHLRLRHQLRLDHGLASRSLPKHSCPFR